MPRQHRSANAKQSPSSAPASRCERSRFRIPCFPTPQPTVPPTTITETSPIDFALAHTAEISICPAEMTTTEKTPRRRQRRRMRSRQYTMPGTVDECGLTLSIRSPQQKNHMFAPFVDLPDHSVGKRFPSPALMRSGLMSPDRQRSVDHQHPLLRPSLQPTRRRHRFAQITLDLPENIDQRRWKRHTVEHRKTKSVILPRFMIRILSDNHRLHPVERARIERVKNQPTRRKHRVPGILRPDERGQLRKIRFIELRLQLPSPALFDFDFHNTRRSTRPPDATDPGRRPEPTPQR